MGIFVMNPVFKRIPSGRCMLMNFIFEGFIFGARSWGKRCLPSMQTDLRFALQPCQRQNSDFHSMCTLAMTPTYSLYNLYDLQYLFIGGLCHLSLCSCEYTCVVYVWICVWGGWTWTHACLGQQPMFSVFLWGSLHLLRHWTWNSDLVTLSDLQVQGKEGPCQTERFTNLYNNRSK